MNNYNDHAYRQPPENVRRDCARSNNAFVNIVWPKISSALGGGVIRPVEILNDIIGRDLDILCGIDYLQIIKGQGCRGIASRVQHSSKNDVNWRTFTIRESRIGSIGETEYEKRRRAIYGEFQGLLAPYLTIQSYIAKNGSLLGCCVARTVDIFRAIEDGKFEMGKYDNATFFIVKYKDIAGCVEF
jgi:hypothetical protein